MTSRRSDDEDAASSYKVAGTGEVMRAVFVLKNHRRAYEPRLNEVIVVVGWS